MPAAEPPRVHYAIDVRLDPSRHRLDGRETITYRSGADSSLTAIYLHAYPNAFAHPYTTYGREMIDRESYEFIFARSDQFGWMTIDSAMVDGEAASVSIDETLARVDLPRPLASGDSLTLSLRFAVGVPELETRLTRSGRRYSIAQWYPKVAVYDDEGWHLERHHYLAEFYGEYATYDVSIAVPDDYGVGSTGLLIGAEGGDNEIPLMASRVSAESVTVRLAPAPAESIHARWPKGGLRVVTDMAEAPHWTPREALADSEGVVALRVPRGAPVHYEYRWVQEPGPTHEEVDAAGASRPRHLVVATSDSVVIDSIRAIAQSSASADSIQPSMKKLRFHATDVHDFAWVAAPDYVRSDTLVDGIAVRALVFREDQKRWNVAPSVTADVVRHNAALLGPYLWPQITTAEAFCGGGAMEYPMLTMNEPEQASSYLREPEDTIAHETSHQWAYGMLGNDERAHAWLDEGFAQYLEIRYMGDAFPDGLLRHARRIPWLSPRTAFDRDEQDYLARAWARDEAPCSTAAEKQISYTRYAVAAYSKPAMMLHTLRGVLGDSTFRRLLHDYYRRGVLRHVGPEDLYAAAADVAESSLAPFFTQWIESTERAGFAIDGVRRERAGDRHLSTVGIKRTEAMVFPITVEARFADGTRQEARVVPLEIRTQVVFESEARLVGAVIDPRHEIVEMNRLDNRTGPVPPIRWRPLYDIPTSEAITASFGPTIWHGKAEGLRVGAWTRGHYLPSNDFPDGILGFEGGLGSGSRRGRSWYRLGAWRRVQPLGARGTVRGRVGRDAGLVSAELWAGNWATAAGRLHPYRWWRVAVSYRDRDDLTPVDARYWALGRTLEVSARLALETTAPRHDARVTLDVRHGASVFRGFGDPAPDASYDRIGLTAIQNWRLGAGGGWVARCRGVAGSAYRRVPNEQLFDVAEAGRIDGLERFYANDRGPLRATGHFLTEGGGGLRGFHDRALLGRSVLGINLDLRRIGWPVSPFLDLGCVGASGVGEAKVPKHDPLVGRMLLDIGFTWAYGPIKITVPLYVSEPRSDESPLGARWLFGFEPIQVPLP